MADIMRRRGMLAEELAPSGITWNDVWSSISRGTYAIDFSIGDVVALPMTGYANPLYMQIIAFDTDIKADNTGYAPITWMARDTIWNRAMTANNSADESYCWHLCSMKTYLNSTWAALLPNGFTDHIVPVKKYSRTYLGAGRTVLNDVESTETIWIPSRYEIGGTATDAETQGITYSSLFDTNEKKIKVKYDTESAVQWRLRTFGTSSSRTCAVSTTGALVATLVKSSGSNSFMVPCFCT